MAPAETMIGRVVDVQGGSFLVEMSDHNQEMSPTRTVGDEDIPIGRIGSYVMVRQGDLQVLGMVIRMTEQEKLIPGTPEQKGEVAVAMPYSARTLKLVPVGSITKAGAFERGIPQYPTTGAEVHVVSSAELETIFVKYKSKGFDIGHHISSSELRVYLDPTSLFGRHMTILGQTGSGKSCTVATLLQHTVKTMPKSHIILLDAHGEYCWKDESGVEKSAFDASIVRCVDAVGLEMPYWLLTFAELCDLCVDRAEISAHNQTTLFRDIVYDLKKKEGDKLGLERTTVDTPIYFSFDELLQRVKEKNEEKIAGERGPKQGPFFGQFDRFILRMESRLNDVRYDFLLKPKVRISSDTLAALLRDFVGLGEPKSAITVIDLSGVPFDVRPTVTAQIGRLAFEFNYWNPQYKEFPILLVCEEAHAYIPRSDTSQFAGARKSMERIAKEGRKYGVGLAVISQRPHELSETVLSQCGTFICMRMTNPEDQNYVRSLVPEGEKDLTETLAGLGRGEALILGEAIPLPTRAQFDLPNPTPNSNDVDFFEKWKVGKDDLDVESIVERWRKQKRSIA